MNLVSRLPIAVRALRLRLLAAGRVRRARRQRPLKLYYGCGNTRQPGYLNVDIRWTPAVDLLGDLARCERWFAGACDEVFLSHVLEHYASPGKALRDTPDTVIGALRQTRRMLRPDGVLRLAVPDFGALARLYAAGRLSLFPRLLGRLCGEQSYPENLHRCAFDREFLEACLRAAGFERSTPWDAAASGLAPDASFDRVDDTPTSLNVLAYPARA